ncbi:zinc-finger double domain-containing protein [Ditylenchus destructor]|uniref:Zinc-finger double domain-containing protein n=1 Tax=Ditylenchus destructor TaxID=166010 RepID=A0AAD4QV28_9BILA|nr:zinc-finger double domain-containing protein [Ditylenchus destructor]
MDSSQLSLLRIFSLPNLCCEINRALESTFKESEFPDEITDIIRLYLERIIYGKSNLANCAGRLNGIYKDKVGSLVLSVRNSIINGLYKRLEKTGIVSLNDSNEQSETEYIFLPQTMNSSHFTSIDVNRAVVSVFKKVDLPAEQMKIVAIYLEQIICYNSNIVNWTVHLDDIDQDQLASLVLSVRYSLINALYRHLVKSGMVELNDSKELPELNSVASQSSCSKMSYKCNHCSYASGNRSHVAQHMKTHTGDKPFKCSLCPYTASFTSNLRKHMRNHTDDKTHKCDKCSYTSHLRSRIETHKQCHDV